MEKLGKFAKSLRQGQTIYNVCVLGTFESYIEKLNVASKPKFRRGIGWFIRVCGEHGKDSRYLRDMNAMHGLNKYNEHRVFFSKRKAEKYLKTCQEFNICFDRGCDYDFDDVYYIDYDF